MKKIPLTIITIATGVFFLIAPVQAEEEVCVCFAKNPSTECTKVTGVTNETCFAQCSQILGDNYASGRYLTTPEEIQSLTDPSVCTELKTVNATPMELEEFESLTPKVGVSIPNLTFSDAILSSGVVSSLFIGQYVAAVYEYLLGVSITIAIVMIMVGGLQYVIGAATPPQIEAAKKRINNAITGLLLLMSTYIILFTINPELLSFKALSLEIIPRVPWEDTLGEEGTPGTGPALQPPCKQVIDKAKSAGVCKMQGSFSSPTGDDPSCNYHWRPEGSQTYRPPAEFALITKVDYPAPWDTPIRAPFDGKVSYIDGATTKKNPCGNTINLKGSGASISICHARDFTNENYQFTGNRTVKKGDIIGHNGGNCCAGSTEIYPVSKERGWCNKSGPKCTDPTKREECSCQDPLQAGNTSGPHVHVTWYPNGGDLLSCLE